MFTLLPTLNDSSVRKVQRNPQGRGSASPRGFSRDEISIGGLEEGLVLVRRRRDKEAASQGQCKARVSSMWVQKAIGKNSRAWGRLVGWGAWERRQADYDVILMCILIAAASSSTVWLFALDLCWFVELPRWLLSLQKSVEGQPLQK